MKARRQRLYQHWWLRQENIDDGSQCNQKIGIETDSSTHQLSGKLLNLCLFLIINLDFNISYAFHFLMKPSGFAAHSFLYLNKFSTPEIYNHGSFYHFALPVPLLVLFSHLTQLSFQSPLLYAALCQHFQFSSPISLYQICPIRPKAG